jgi:transcriptional regulator with XRE-family HTH domain
MIPIEEDFRKHLLAAIEQTSEAEVASRANVSQGAISKILSGKQKKMKTKTYEGLALATNYRVDRPTAALKELVDGESATQLKALNAEAASHPPQSASSSSTGSVMNRKAAIKTVLHEDYLTTDYLKDFARAKKLWITGLNLRRIVDGRLKDLANVLSREGGKIQLILLEPDCNACAYAAIQEWGRGDDDSVKNYIKTIVEAHKSFCELQTKSANGENFEIKKIDYALAFGLDAMEFDDPNDGAVYVRFYPLECGLDDRPILPLRTSDGYWYQFYKAQFDLHWNRATEWGCPKKEKLEE